MLERPLLRWPDGRHLALYVGLQIDAYDTEDRGVPAGLWRIADLFDQLEMRPSALISTETCRLHPEVLEMGGKRSWAWVVRSEDSLRGTFRTIELVTGDRPRGWLRSRDSMHAAATLELVCELGATYVLEPSEGNQPCLWRQGRGGLVSVPYTYELDDVLAFSKAGTDGATFGRMLIDQFDVLYAESQSTARVMSISLHPSVIGQPFRYKHFAQALYYMAAHEGVWLATSDEIADYFAMSGQPHTQTHMFEELPLG
jgi:allantoinase